MFTCIKRAGLRLELGLKSFELDLCWSPRSLQTMESLLLVKLNVTGEDSREVRQAGRAYKYWGSRISWDPDRGTRPCSGR